MELNVFEMLLQKMVPCWFVPTLLKTSIYIFACYLKYQERKEEQNARYMCGRLAANMLSKEAFRSVCVRNIY
jgi:hypothetical protein